jgi:hypothetical protein
MGELVSQLAAGEAIGIGRATARGGDDVEC